MNVDPIFVVGNSRSGTTMMSRILGRHPNVYGLRELHFCEELFTAQEFGNLLSDKESLHLVGTLLSIQREGYVAPRRPAKYVHEASEVLSSVSERTPASLFRAFMLYEARKHGKLIPCEQTPNNLYYIRDLLGVYHDARFVNLVRDPRDVLLSQKNKWKRFRLGTTSMGYPQIARAWANYHPVTISKLWKAAILNADTYREDEHVQTVRFESICENPSRTIADVFDKLGLTYDDSVLEVPRVGSSTRINSPENKGIDASRAGAWTRGGLTESEIFICERICGDVMRRYGYEPSGISPSSLQVARDVISFPVKIGAAFTLNISRMRSINETLRRRFVTSRAI